MTENDVDGSHSSIAVLWNDGNAHIINVLPTENPSIGDESHPCPSDTATNSNDICTRGIDNVAFQDTIEGTRVEIDNPTCSRDNSIGPFTRNYRTARDMSRKYLCHLRGNTCSHSNSNNTSSPINSTSNITNGVVVSTYTNASFIDASDEIRNDHPSCTCPNNILTDEDITVRELTIGNARNQTHTTNKTCKQSSRSSRSCSLKQNIIRASGSNSQTNTSVTVDVVVEETPPPLYNSLAHIFLRDEPPRYEDVTGKTLRSTDITVPVSNVVDFSNLFALHFEYRTDTDTCKLPA